ncbi:MAG: hypothetical protein WBB69_12785 [Anaerolineales bacterium]
MAKTLIGLFLIAHAIAHAGLAAAPVPEDPDPKPGAFFTAPARSWIFQRINLDSVPVQKIGVILVILSVLGFILAGTGALGVPGLKGIWQTTAAVSATISLTLLVIYWHPWLILGVLIDTGLVVLTCLNSWPS